MLKNKTELLLGFEGRGFMEILKRLINASHSVQRTAFIGTLRGGVFIAPYRVV